MGSSSWPGIEPRPPALGAWSLSYWITREVPAFPFLYLKSLSQHQGLFQWVSSLHQVTKVVELPLQHQSFQWISRVDFLYDWLVWCWERLKVKEEAGSRGWDVEIASLVQCTWIWANSGRSWRTGKPTVLQCIESQRIRHDLATKLTHIWKIRGLTCVLQFPIHFKILTDPQ